MRLVLILVILALLLAILGFAITNLETRTAVTFWETTYQDVPLWSIVFLSVLSGVVSVGLIAVVDGAFVRLHARRLAREVTRLETELNWLRTQPAVDRREPDQPEGPETRAEEASGEEAEGIVRSDPPSAPVYQSGETDDGDDPYSGGRAV